MNQVLFTLFFFFGPCVTSSSLANALYPSAPFNLWWGMNLSQVEVLGGKIEEEWEVWQRTKAVRVRSLPNTPPNTGSMILIFHEELGLQKVNWAGKPILDDKGGTQGKTRFRELKGTLSNNYGVPIRTKEQIFLDLNAAQLDFYLCLQGQDCGEWIAVWEAPDSSTLILILELVGLDVGTGFVQITYQGPDLGEMFQRIHTDLLTVQ